MFCGKMANLHEKHQRILAEMLREEANRVCADCGSRGVRYVCVCVRLCVPVCASTVGDVSSVPPVLPLTILVGQSIVYGSAAHN